jgi:hypothetical protein
MWIFEVRQKPHFGDVKSNFDVVRDLAILFGFDVLDFDFFWVVKRWRAPPHQPQQTTDGARLRFFFFSYL